MKLSKRIRRKKLIAQILIKSGSIRAGNNNKMIPKQLENLINELNLFDKKIK